MLAGLAVSSVCGRTTRYDFCFSRGAFRDNEIFESATSTPSRYLLEVGRRLCKAEPSADRLVIGNPLLPLTADRLAEWMGNGCAEPLVATNEAGFPIFYVLPRQVFAEAERLLLLLSTVDGALDARLLEFIAGTRIEHRAVHLGRLDAFPAMSANGWMNPDNRLRSLKKQGEVGLSIMEARADWRELPFVAFHPYHAGDALFFALASTQAAPLLFDKHLVCSAFKDVVVRCSPRTEPVDLPMAPMARDGSVSKYRYFVNALEGLGSDFTGSNYLIFSRLLRMHHFTPFHLIDHAKFTLGDPMERIDKTIYGQPAHPVSRCPLPTSPLRVLFHLNGGWPLKTYPEQETRVLFQVLKGLGWDITVIDRPDLEPAGARSVPAGTAAGLTALIETHHLFVGVDSLPLHFAHLIMGRPTVALFGSTKPCNHDAPRADGYRALVNHLPCNSCLAKDGCPMLGGAECINYAKPRVVASELVELAFTHYGFWPG